MSAVRVKVCGFTVLADVHAAADSGVDAFGFNLAGGPRQRSPEVIAELVRAVPPFAVSVALVMNLSVADTLAIINTTRAQVVQLHGDEPPEVAEELQRHLPVIKAFRVRDAATLAAAAEYPCDGVLLDAYVPGVAGGTGAAWDRRLVNEQSFSVPMIIAGGLHPGSVAAAIADVHPAGVDVASGVERDTPGRKDPGLMHDFVTAVRTAEER